MPEPVKPVAVIQGGPSEAIQAVLRDFADAAAASAQVAGVVERRPVSGTGDPELCTLGEALRFPIFQDLGPSSTACSLDSAGIVSACEAVRRQIARGCDLLVLSKFGKLEAERSGLAAAFSAGVDAQVPILTSVAPKFDAQWAAFAAPLFVVLPPRLDAIDSWWRGVTQQRAAASSRARPEPAGQS